MIWWPSVSSVNYLHCLLGGHHKFPVSSIRIRYVVRFLKSGIMKNGMIEGNEVCTKQGNKMSPVLANIFMHYVVDDWFEKGVKKRQGYVIYKVIAIFFWYQRKDMSHGSWGNQEKELHKVQEISYQKHQEPRFVIAKDVN